MDRRFLKHAVFFVVTFSVFFVAPTFFWTHPTEAEREIKWGVDYSVSQAKYLGLDPDETYDAIVHDLGVKHIKIHLNWNSLEPQDDVYDFSKLDRQVSVAEQNDVKLILVVGMKTGRWPECHTPTWMNDVDPTARQVKIVEHTKAIVERYKNSQAIEYWQVENEPFLEFGTCPKWYYRNNGELVKAEVALVRELDPARSIIISDSGELSDWTEAAEHGDIVGITMYRNTWNKATETFGLNPYTFLTPKYYSTKAAYIHQRYKKTVISIELQAEPWTAKSLTESKLEIQEQSMNLELFRENVQFAREVDLDAYYFWGVEWWYWMKIKHNKPEIWDEAKAIFNS
jgi:hypothetical protein